MILFLDDNLARTEMFLESYPNAITVTTAAETIKLLNENKVDKLFLDHDLGGESQVDSNRTDTGMEVVRWMLNNVCDVGSIIVHSMNFTAGPAMAKKLLDAGFNADYKPFKTLFPDYMGV